MSYIYLLGICGTGVGALAGMLKRQGHRVAGSDEHVYPPMSDKLREWGIEVFEGYDAKHLSPRPDLVVVGNVIRAQNPEAQAAREFELLQLSMPQAIARFGIGDKHSVVIAGTHGKTTTSALAAHVLVSAGRDPSFLVGGAMVGYAESFRVGAGPYFVVEGDEYDTAYFDKGPKFLHYRPRTAVITSLEYDHADIYGSIADLERAFAKLVATVPEEGRLVVWCGAERALALLDKARAREVIRYSERPRKEADLWLEDVASGPDGLSFVPVFRGRALGPMRAPLYGEVGLQNVAAVIGALMAAGLTPPELALGLASFQGVKRRLEVIGEPRGVTVVDDFGHHPTAVRGTLAAARTRWPGRRLWAIFEPRSATSRRNVLQHEYEAAFSDADEVVIASHERLAEIPVSSRFDPFGLAGALCARGGHARAIPLVDDIVATLAEEARAGDVVIVFSNGSFGGLHRALLAALANEG